MLDSIIKKNWFIATLGILTIIATGSLIGIVIYYKRKGATAESPQDDSKAEEKIKELEQKISRLQNNKEPKDKLLFLKESQDRIKKLEEDVKKEQGKKEYKKNELEKLIAEKLANERSKEITDIKNGDYKLLNTMVLDVIEMNPIIKTINDEIKKCKTEDDVYKKLAKKRKIESFKIIIDKVLAAIIFFHDPPTYSKSFFYLYYYFLKQFNLYESNGPNRKEEIENEVINLLNTDNYGRIFKIYLLVEKILVTKIENYETLLETHIKKTEDQKFISFAWLLKEIINRFYD